MPNNPKIEEFRRLIDALDEDTARETFRAEAEALREHPRLAPYITGDTLDLENLPEADVAVLIGNRGTVGYYFLLACTDHSRTSLKRAVGDLGDEVPRGSRYARALKASFPPTADFGTVVGRSVSDRARTLGRARSAQVEALFRDLLKDEGIGVVMSSADYVVRVPGLLVGQRKPDGAYPDPRAGKAPRIYLEVKNVKRVSDDIQKRLYEIAQASLEMKFLYGDLDLRGLNATPAEAEERTREYRSALREAVTKSAPVVVGLLLCSRVAAEPYREGIEAFVDRVFFAREEVEDCLEYLKATIARFQAG